MSDSVLCLGLTPAVQRTLVFERFAPGEVNRAVESHQTSAGKAVNTAVALAALGTPACVTGFNGGAAQVSRRLCAGARRPRCLRRCAADAIARRYDAGRIIRAGGEVPAGRRRARGFAARNERLRRGAPVAISGRCAGTPDDFYVPSRAGRARGSGGNRLPRESCCTFCRFSRCRQAHGRELEKTFGAAWPGAAIMRAARRGGRRAMGM